MNATIWQYAISLLYIGGLFVVLIRYHHTRVFVPSFLGFVFLLTAPYVQWWLRGLMTQSASELAWLWITLSAWIPLLGFYLILVSLVKITHAKHTKVSSLYRTTGIIIVFLILVGSTIFAIVNGHIRLFRFNYPHLVYYFLAGIGFLGCSVAIFNRFSTRWFGIIGAAAFALLSITNILFFGSMAGLSSVGLSFEFLLDFASLVITLAWAAILVFFITVPRGEMDSHPAWAGFIMTQRRWGGVVTIVIGLLICAWQIYEVHSGEHFTFWMVGGFIPLPVILLGILAVLGGLVTLIRE